MASPVANEVPGSQRSVAESNFVLPSHNGFFRHQYGTNCVCVCVLRKIIPASFIFIFYHHLNGFIATFSYFNRISAIFFLSLPFQLQRIDFHFLFLHLTLPSFSPSCGSRTVSDFYTLILSSFTHSLFLYLPNVCLHNITCHFPNLLSYPYSIIIFQNICTHSVFFPFNFFSISHFF